EIDGGRRDGGTRPQRRVATGGAADDRRLGPHRAVLRVANQEATVPPTRSLHDVGQSLWLDNITRDLLEKGTLERYIEELSVTGLTSNPTIFDHAVTHSASYDGEIRNLGGPGASNKATFFKLACAD